MEIVWKLPIELDKQFRKMEQEAYSNLVTGNFKEAEKIYTQQYDIFRKEEQRLPLDKKYHKGGPLHNWGIALLLQKKVLHAFQNIALAYIEDLLNLKNVESALDAPAYKTLHSYPLVSEELLNQLKKLVIQIRKEDRVPRNPEAVMHEYNKKGYAALSSSFTDEKIKETPPTKDLYKGFIQKQLEGLGRKEKRVFVGGSYRNIVLLRYIVDIVEKFDDFKAILPIDLPKFSSENYDELIHDMSMEYLEGCSKAIFEVSISNGHLMEIERANNIKNLDILLLFQQSKVDDKPIITKMLLTESLDKKGYQNLIELSSKIGKFLGMI